MRLTVWADHTSLKIAKIDVADEQILYADPHILPYLFNDKSWIPNFYHLLAQGFCLTIEALEASLHPALDPAPLFPYAKT